MCLLCCIIEWMLELKRKTFRHNPTEEDGRVGKANRHPENSDCVSTGLSHLVGMDRMGKEFKAGLVWK